MKVAAIKFAIWMVLLALAFGYFTGTASAQDSSGGDEEVIAPEQGIAPVVPPLIQVPVDDGSGGYTPEICPDQFPSIAAAQNSNCVEEYPPPVEQGITAPLDMSNTVTRQPVQGEGAVRPPTPLPPALAITGATTEALVLIGLVLVAMGLGMVHGHLVVRSVTKWWEERS